MKELFSNINTIRIIIDFGLLILIWIVQLIIYPGFRFYGRKNLINWHQYYLPKFSMIVAPLMFIQLNIAAYGFFTETNWKLIIYFVLVISTWISTLLYFVPLHRNLTKQVNMSESARRLESGNWWRTLQWSLIFIWSIILLSS